MRALRLAPAPMAALALALAAALLAPSAASAQDAQRLREAAQQMRANVEKLGDNLPPDARAAMLKQADDLERQAAKGDGPALPRAPTNAERIMAEHGRLDWLFAELACAGYTQDNFDTFRYERAINDRDSHCRNAHGHWATYVRRSKDPSDVEGQEQALFYYDAAAKRAVGLYGKR